MTNADQTFVIHAVAELDRDQCRLLREELCRQLAAGQLEVVLDLSETGRMSAAATYLLLAAKKSLEAKGGRLLLRHLRDEVREWLTGLHLLGEGTAFGNVAEG